MTYGHTSVIRRYIILLRQALGLSAAVDFFLQMLVIRISGGTRKHDINTIKHWNLVHRYTANNNNQYSPGQKRQTTERAGMTKEWQGDESRTAGEKNGRTKMTSHKT
ncbi:hypothetical protein CBL_12585 [Carabus blaptoides fortunei]